MIIAYQQLTTYEEDNWQEFLDRICLYDIFKDLILKHGVNKSLLKSFIRYIVWAYSRESDMIILGTDWGKNKRRIFDAAGFEPIEILLNATVNLQDDVVVSTIHKWLSFQDDYVHTQLSVLKDLMVEMQISANSPIRKASGEIDFDQKYKNACYVKDLRRMISDLESELVQNSPKLQEGATELRNTNKRVIISAEKYAK
jgi:hypothetical protein